MAFRFNKKNGTKAAFRAQVSRKHKMFKRFKKRFMSAKTPTEKRFCKNEAAKVVKQLKTFSKQYRKFGFGASSWITKNYSMTNFTSNSRKTTKYGKRTYGRRTSKTYGRTTRSWSRRRNSRSNARRSSNARKSYVAW